MMNKKPTLGRGLADLLGHASPRPTPPANAIGSMRVVSSSEIPTAVPTLQAAPAGEELAKLPLDVLQRDAEEVAFIDDREGNCEAARALGIHAICYHDEAQCVRALEQLGLEIGVETRV